MADRKQFLTTIREAAARGRAHRVAINPAATHTAAYVGGGEDKVGSFLVEWLAVGGQGRRVCGQAGFRDYLLELLAKSQPQRVLRWSHPLLQRLGLDALLAEQNIAVTAWNELEQQPASERWPTAFAADLGITSVDWAVAETGTLALCSLPGQGRVVSLLPPTYLAVIEPAQIVPDLFDLFDRLGERRENLPSNVSLVTGPSKTGDIELKLTTGVHGPGNVNVVIVEESPPHSG
ncbi:MAG: lactate utilization protein C [Planctomycetes bacterium]|nr:lactate utilization protein C [Planctomycetota bacterium]